MNLGRKPTLSHLIALLILSFSSWQLLATSQQSILADYDCELQTLVGAELPRKCGLWYLNYPKPPVSPKLRLSNGYPVQKGQFPSFVKVHFYHKPDKGNKTEWWCGGVIVTKWHILTAAHCIKNHTYSLSNSYVFDPTNQKSRHRSEKYCLLENFYEKANKSRVTPYVKNDIALLRVVKPIEFNKLVQPVCLPGVPLEETPTKDVQVVGLGFIEDNESGGEATTHRPSSSLSSEYQERLQILPSVPHMSVMQPVECKPKDRDESTICFVPKCGGGSICRGDSGGPVYGLDSLGRQVLYGVPSYVDLPCTSSLAHKSVMANVWALREPIKRLIERC